MKVYVKKDGTPYSTDYEAYLMGWVEVGGRIMAIVAKDDGDEPWVVSMSRIRLRV